MNHNEYVWFGYIQPLFVGNNKMTVQDTTGKNYMFL